MDEIDKLIRNVMKFHKQSKPDDGPEEGETVEVDEKRPDGTRYQARTTGDDRARAVYRKMMQECPEEFIEELVRLNNVTMTAIATIAFAAEATKQKKLAFTKDADSAKRFFYRSLKNLENANAKLEYFDINLILKYDKDFEQFDMKAITEMTDKLSKLMKEDDNAV